MHIHILYTFRGGMWGGGNQFLNFLRNFFRKNEVYTDDVSKAKIVLVDSYQNIGAAVFLKFRFPHIHMLYRLGPVFSYHRGKWWRMMDRLMAVYANTLSDGVIFQSQWSQDEFMKYGFLNKKYCIIHNAVDKNIFYLPKEKKSFGNIRLITTSWSNNPNKGFTFLQYLDEHLDFKKYSMKFIGNSPVTFKNIQRIPPQPSHKVADELRLSDIYISPTRFEACSNALLEALACGLPVVALKSGGNTELIQGNGELFDTEQELMEKIHQVTLRYDEYQERIVAIDPDVVGQQYMKFAQEIIQTPVRRVSKAMLYLLYIHYSMVKFMLRIFEYVRV